jgi:hypothetical protein
MPSVEAKAASFSIASPRVVDRHSESLSRQTDMTRDAGSAIRLATFGGR